ncbi:UDP-N-acetylmuramoyl-tripeptide--D-alanyl-D-alanine ligase [Nocardioides cynanchi]|uniref:UDP-N-acetylmuramoyl-tripeptide--D-alanyl-D- alanine ligase n=1 Tax=Nocardioides cynanchi TaxID=2558918 RepID=UPI003B52EB94
MTLAEIAAVVGGQVADVPGNAGPVTAPAFVDTREIAAGGLFVAVAGERVDGHDFAEAAVAGGAAGVLAARPTGVPTVVVDDPVRALGRLARHVVDTLRPTVLALTGSQGKTGTKDFLAQVLAAAGPTIWTEGNRNNEIGVPLTVLRTTTDTRFLALEMGARGIGHIAELCAVAPPQVAAVLNVGTAHLGEFGSREAIATAKGEIVEALPDDGTAVLNADDVLVAAMAARTRARVLTFGVAGDVAWRSLELDDLGRPTVELGYDGERASVQLLEAGAHQVANAAAAAAMALAAGVGWDDVVTALGAARSLSPWRMALHQRPDGLVVVNDSYNANPASMNAALDALAAIGTRGGRRTVAVLGEMLELGQESDDQHAEVGEHAAGLGIDVLVTVGAAADAIAEGACRTPGWKGEVVRTAGREPAGTWLRHNVGARDAVLVKASRGAALEHLADVLLDVPAEAREGGSPSR